MDKTTYAGWHLMFDAVVRDPGWIRDVDRIRSFLLELIPRLDMELLDGPRITEVELDPSQMAGDLDDGGITGYALITTSHLSIHTWPLRNRFCLDVFSCRRFDPQVVVDFAREHFGVVDANSHWVERLWPSTPAKMPAPVALSAAPAPPR
jgi:S-adenosylmethionine/arginine decarboxylase-like enzyme